MVVISGLEPEFASPVQPSFYGNDLAAHRVSDLGNGARAIVLFFVASDCPISNRYFPEMERLRHRFSPQGVAFYYVYPNVTETPASIRAHEATYAPHAAGLETLTDPRQELARLTRARTTPEAAILLPQTGSVRAVYVGRIDNRYVSLGEERPSATEHDLELALRAALDHQPVPAPGGPAVGCAIVNTR